MRRKLFLFSLLALVAVSSELFSSLVLIHAEVSSIPGTLIGRIDHYLRSSLINWSENYYGLLFNKQSKTDFEQYVDRLANAGDYLNVLRWSARLKKLGIEREQAIRDSLSNLGKAGELPATGIDYYGASYWSVYEREVLYSVYYYSGKYDFLTDKWNATRAYSFMRDAIAGNGSNGNPSVSEIYENGKVSQMSNRYYDENAETASAYLIFHELGVDSALESARNIWNYVNANHWNAIGYFSYTPRGAGFECEFPYFTKIFSLLQWFDSSVGNMSRLATDMQTRFLSQAWQSPQWRENPNGSLSYVVLHMNPSNPERRLQNTLGAWFAMLGMYTTLNLQCQANLRAMLRGDNVSDQAWELLYSPNARLYEGSTDLFKMMSTGPSGTSEATALALTLQFLMGIVPVSTTIAYPLEEYHYEYNYDIDPDLFNLDITAHRLRIAVAKGGTIEFEYGDFAVPYSFPTKGVYDIDFSDDWNIILNASRRGDLPSDRRFLSLPQMPMHDLAAVNLTLSGYAAGLGETVNVELSISNNGLSQEIFNVTAYANLSTIGTIAGLTLNPGDSVNVSLTWDTTGFSPGRYIASAYVWPVTNETGVDDNTITDEKGVILYDSSSHDIAVAGFASRTIVAEQSVLKTNVSFVNFGGYDEAFNVTFYANETDIQRSTEALSVGAETSAEFVWNTTSFVKGIYTIRIYAWPVAGETSTSDNTLERSIMISIPGDINGDQYVTAKDAVILGGAFGFKPGDLNWKPNADINDDGYVNAKEPVILGTYFGQHWP